MHVSITPCKTFSRCPVNGPAGEQLIEIQDAHDLHTVLQLLDSLSSCSTKLTQPYYFKAWLAPLPTSDRIAKESKTQAVLPRVLTCVDGGRYVRRATNIPSDKMPVHCAQRPVLLAARASLVLPKTSHGHPVVLVSLSEVHLGWSWRLPRFPKRH